MIEGFTDADEAPAVDVDTSRSFNDPQQLEELAEAMLRAAEWLRSQAEPTEGVTR